MRQKFPLAISIAALVVAVLGATGPAVAHGVQHALFAHNADKVDGRHAVGASATVNGRKGNLVATNGTTGRLPNSIIAKAPDANLLDGLNSTAFLRAGATAADANMLDGLDSTAFLAAGAKAVDAELLDGIDSASFVRGGGTVLRDAVNLSPGTSHTLATGLSTVQYSCPATLSNQGTITYTNTSAGLVPVWFDDGSSVTFTRVGVSPAAVATTATGDHVTIGAVHQLGTIRSTRVDVFSVHDPANVICSVYFMAVTN